MAEYPVAAATSPNRHRDRMRYDVATVHAILDAGFLAHLSFVIDGRPQLIPLAYGRDGESLYLHASSGSQLALAVRASGAEGFPVVAAVTHVDSMVLSRSAMHHSMDYHCVMAHGGLKHVADRAEQLHASRVIIDHLVPGRADDCREPNAKELAQTSMFRLDLDQVAAKVRDHGLAEDENDLDLPYWAGVAPLATVRGPLRPDRDQEPPAYLAAWLDAS
ncbi:pyridoxamine 5'-phosphate oxidase family protein [Streptomyces sp. SID3343]|uniref:pyridoxamine 5'-phosphate oxidase family protein n=1 Tax=Streptomyces sp. SID3343 TaxID=2690260 RepID=UPI001368F45A|nr:pyridoxamine 5'-phosphate oxidase family protein [Streptomyces sp. SID3343]